MEKMTGKRIGRPSKWTAKEHEARKKYLAEKKRLSEVKRKEVLDRIAKEAEALEAQKRHEEIQRKIRNMASDERRNFLRDLIEKFLQNGASMKIIQRLDQIQNSKPRKILPRSFAPFSFQMACDGTKGNGLCLFKGELRQFLFQFKKGNGWEILAAGF